MPSAVLLAHLKDTDIDMIGRPLAKQELPVIAGVVSENQRNIRQNQQHLQQLNRRLTLLEAKNQDYDPTAEPESFWVNSDHTPPSLPTAATQAQPKGSLSPTYNPPSPSYADVEMDRLTASNAELEETQAQLKDANAKLTDINAELEGTIKLLNADLADVENTAKKYLEDVLEYQKSATEALKENVALRERNEVLAAKAFQFELENQQLKKQLEEKEFIDDLDYD